LRALVFRLLANLLHFCGFSGWVDTFSGKLAPPNRLRRSIGISHNKNSYQVLNYHRVNSDREPFGLLPVTPKEFESQIQYLKRHYQILPLKSLLHRADDQGDLPTRCIAITFDDGYLDNYQFAFPILKRNGVPATLFAVTESLERQEPLWYDKVFFAFRSTTQSHLSLPDIFGEKLILITKEMKLAACDRVLRLLKNLPEAQRLEQTTVLFSALAIKDFAPMGKMMMGWSEARELQAGGFEIEAHSVSHPILTRITGDRLQAEISGCKRTLEEKLQKEIKVFAYPNGQPGDFNENVAQVLAANGFKHAFTTVFGKNRPDSDPYTLKRAMSWYYDIPRFELCQSIINLRE
jgi:peptidoglycan/xylan/chitin deacetylase (PgdA/CDA1 family)